MIFQQEERSAKRKLYFRFFFIAEFVILYNVLALLNIIFTLNNLCRIFCYY